MVFLINHCINDNQSLLRAHNGCSVLMTSIKSQHTTMNDQHCSTIRNSCPCWWQHAPGGEPKGSCSVTRAYEATMIVVETLANCWLQPMAEKRLLELVLLTLELFDIAQSNEIGLLKMLGFSWFFMVATWDYHRAYRRGIFFSENDQPKETRHYTPGLTSG